MDSLVARAAEHVAAQIALRFPLVPGGRQRVEALARSGTEDYLAGPERVRSSLLNELFKIGVCNQHGCSQKGCASNRAQLQCPLRRPAGGESLDREPFASFLAWGAYVYLSVVESYRMTPRGLEALETGKLAALDEEILELLCSEVRKLVLASVDGKLG